MVGIVLLENAIRMRDCSFAEKEPYALHSLLPIDVAHCNKRTMRWANNIISIDI